MGHHKTGHDSVAITGSAIGLISALFGWFTLKANRLATGTSLRLWQVDWQIAAIIMILWFACLLLSIRLKPGSRTVLLGVTANLILVVIFIFTGLTASGVMASQPQITRVSASSGTWVALAGAYMVIFAVRQRLTGLRTWQNIVSWSALVLLAGLIAAGWFNNISILQEFNSWRDRFWHELLNHIFLFAGSVAIGTLIGIPLGIWATRNLRAQKPIFFITGIIETIPSLALFGFLIAPLSALSFAFPVLREFGIQGIGATPAIIALVIYSLMPIVRNTYTGLKQIDRAIIDAGHGTGMSRRQVFQKIEVPLAAPLALEGVRTAMVQAVGIAAVAALIGAGGLGLFVFQGIGQGAPDLVILGAIPIIILAVFVDAVMRLIIRLSTPKGIKTGNL